MPIDPPLATAAETPQQIRAAHLQHEASVRSIGLLYYLGAALTSFGGIVSLLDPKSPGSTRLVAGVLVLLAIVYAYVGRQFQVLSPKAKVPGTILAAIGLIGFPIGTLINAYILYLIHSAKGTVVFSPGYAAVIAATPDMKYQTSRVTWVLLIVLALIFVLIGLGLFFAGNTPH